MFLSYLISAIVFNQLHYVVEAIQCYECTSSQGKDCLAQASKCETGFFGCTKIAAFNGGVDKMGMWSPDQERRIFTMIRGCSIIPLGRADICEQTSILGTRIIKCTCFTDFCNSSFTPKLGISIMFFFLFRFIELFF